MGCVEVGYCWSRERKESDSSSDAPVGAMVGSILALLAFMLAFTFGIASSRFDTRRLLVVDDANAIGTCYLRAGYLEEPHKTEVRAILKDYVAVRLHAHRNPQTSSDALTQSSDLQNKLWAETEAVAIAHPNLAAYSLFIASVNEVIDVYGKRLAAGLDARVPMSVWITLFIVAAIAMLGTGYFCGMNGRRHTPEALLLVLAFSLVLMIVVDLDRPWEGTIATPQTPMIRLAKQLGVS